jgi:hypothetical protein
MLRSSFASALSALVGLSGITGRSLRLSMVGLVFGCVFILMLPADVTAQQSRATIKELSSLEEKPFEDQFWKYLIGNNYKNWAPGPGQTGDFYTGQNPHGALLKMYLNRTAAGRTHDFPMGSVIILENYRADQSLKTISVMYRTDGFNPEGNDWYWVDYNPDGTVVKAPVSGQTKVNQVSVNSGMLKKTMGRATNCMGCHQGGEGLDFVFFNDKAVDGESLGSFQRMADKQPQLEAR